MYVSRGNGKIDFPNLYPCFYTADQEFATGALPIHLFLHPQAQELQRSARTCHFTFKTF